MPSSGRPAFGLSMLAALARHALRRDEFGRHQPHGVALRLELPRPVVRRPEQASMAITLGGSAAIIAPSLARAPQFDPPLGQCHAVAPNATKLARLPLPSSRQAARSAPSRHAACGAHRVRRRADAKLAIQVLPCQCSCGKSCRWHTGRALVGRQLGRRLEDSSNRNRFGPLSGSCCNADHSQGRRRATVGGSSQPGAGSGQAARAGLHS